MTERKMTFKNYRVTARGENNITLRAGTDEEGRSRWSRPQEGDVVALSELAANQFIGEGLVEVKPVDKPPSPFRFHEPKVKSAEETVSE